MNILAKIKKNRFIRGLYFLYKNYIHAPASKFGFYGKDINIIPPITISNPENVYLHGNNGLNNATILTTNARFVMYPNSGAASGLKVITGNHARIVGFPYRCITEEMKPQGFDKDVIVKEDVWMGVNVTLLSGVTLERGVTVAAGAVVSRSMPPYCICAGVPAKVIKFYWTIDQILEHEKQIYPESARYKVTELEDIFAQYKATK